MVNIPIQFLKYSQDVFKFFGLWDKQGKNKTFKALFIKYTVVMVMGCLIPIITLSDTISAGMKGDVPLSLTKALYGFAYLVCFHKLAAAAFFNDEISCCICQLEKMSQKFENPIDINESINTYKMMATIGSIAMNLCGAFFILAPIAKREFPYNPHLAILDFSKSPYYELMYVYQSMAIIVVTNVMLAYDTMFCGIMSLCGGVLASISRETNQIDLNKYPAKDAEILLKQIIEKLIEISSLIDRISEIFSFTTITSISYNCSLMALGLFLVSFLPYSDLTCIAMIFVIIVEAFQLWIYCYFGQVVVNEKQLLQTELYCITWYNGSKSFKSMLLLTIFEAQNDRYIKAGKMIPLSMRTFTEVLKKAYAFYAFMNEAR